MPNHAVSFAYLVSYSLLCIQSPTSDLCHLLLQSIVFCALLCLLSFLCLLILLRHHHGHRKEGTALEPLRLWTSTIDELFYIEQWLSPAKVWHVGQSWTEVTDDSKFMQEKWTYSIVFIALLSRQHLETYKNKLVDVSGLNPRNKVQRWAGWDDWASCVTDRQTLFVFI